MNNKIIIGVVTLFILAILGFSLMYFSGGPSDTTVSIVGKTATDTPEMVADREYQIILSKFKNIHFATSTLNDKVFLSLVDEGVILQEEPFTRVNPFAPIGSEGSSTNMQRSNQIQLQSQFQNNLKGRWRVISLQSI